MFKRAQDKLKFWLWMQTRGRRYHRQYERTLSLRAAFRIHDSLETIDHINQTGCSVSRWGDGELQIMQAYLDELERGEVNLNVDTFQKYNQGLGKRLYEIFYAEPLQNHIVCVPYAFKDASVHRGYERICVEREALCRFSLIDSVVKARELYDTNFTRFYMGRKDIKDYPAYVRQLKRIWQGRDILFVEGEKSRLGVGNDLFSEARSVQRILCPVVNAWDWYDEILTETQRFASGKLVLIALGQTATVLAYDLARCNHQAIDLGHVDIEYEWLRMRAKTKVAISGKYVNEVADGRIVGLPSDLQMYEAQVVARIGL